MDIDPPSQIEDKDLFKAAETGDSSAFKSLPPELLSKALALQNEDGRSVLHVAASSGHPEVILFYLTFCDLVGSEFEFYFLGYCGGVEIRW